MKVDSRVLTYEHIQCLQGILGELIGDLQHRQLVHDRSKLCSPEVEIFDEFTGRLASSSYGSDEYNGFLAEMRPALVHHYHVNRHHPEFHVEGVLGMTLVDLLEMLSDWKAASLRHADGNLLRSIEINQKRFGYGEELKRIFINTVLGNKCLGV